MRSQVRQVFPSVGLQLDYMGTLIQARVPNPSNLIPSNHFASRSVRQAGSSCEYSHYSVIEKKTHSWWADCSKNGPQ